MWCVPESSQGVVRKTKTTPVPKASRDVPHTGMHDTTPGVWHGRLSKTKPAPSVAARRLLAREAKAVSSHRYFQVATDRQSIMKEQSRCDLRGRVRLGPSCRCRWIRPD